METCLGGRIDRTGCVGEGGREAGGGEDAGRDTGKSSGSLRVPSETSGSRAQRAGRNGGEEPKLKVPDG